MLDPKFLVNVKKYYKGEAHQKKALKMFKESTKVDILKTNDCDLIELQAELPENFLNNFALMWRTPESPIILPANWQAQPYNSQLDNPINPHSTCNSSAHWMFIRSCNPKVSKSDSTYVNEVMAGKFGRKFERNPSIWWDVHTRGAKHYKVSSQVMSGDIESAIAQAQKGIVTPTNILHRSNINNPTGGHVVCIVAYNSKEDRLYIHDPYGQLDYINGTSDLSKSGKYWVTKRNFSRRWQGLWTKKL